MIDFAIGVAVGTAFAPFWMMVYTRWIKPVISSVFTPKK